MTLVAVLCTLALTAVPAVAVAGGDGLPASGGISMFTSFLQMALALLVVVGLILLIYYGATRLMKTVPAFGQAGRLIRLLEIRPLGPRKSLVLVEVEGEYLLLAVSDNQITLIKQITMLEEIEVLEDKGSHSSFLSFLGRSATPPQP